MSELNFKVSAGYKEVEKLRREVEELKKELKDFNVSADMKGFDELNKKYAEATGKLEEYEKKIASYQRTIEQLKISNGIAESAKQTTAEVNNATDSFVEQSIKLKELQEELKKLNKNYLSLSDSERKGVNGQALVKELKEKTNLYYVENEALKKYRKELTDTVKIENVASDSIIALRKELSKLNAAYDSLSATERKGQIGEGLKKQIQELTQEISEAEQATGRFQRNVGNYSSAFNGLGMSVQQVARELPSLAIGWNTFFLAISNNLPTLVDELKKASVEYKAFQAAVAAGNTNVAKVAPVWKQLISSIFSWQTALVAAITLLSVYGKDVIEFAKSLLTSTKQAKTLAEMQDDINKSYKESTGEIGEQITSLKKLQSEWNDLGGNLKKQKQFIERNRSAFEQMGVSIESVQDAENLLVKNTNRFIEALKLRAQASAAQKLASEQYAKQLQLEQDIKEKYTEAEKQRDSEEIAASAYIQDTRYGTVKTAKQINEELAKGIENQAKALEKEAEQVKKTADSYFELSIEKEKAAENTMVEAGIKPFEDNSAYDKKEKKLNKEAEKQAEIQRRVNEQLLELRRQNQQSEIDLMKEGTDKKIAQINLDYDRQIEELKKKEKEWREAQSGKLTEEQQKTITVSYVNAWANKARSEQQVETDQFESERRAMNEYLIEYGDFQDKKKAIANKYNLLISKATTKGERLSLDKEMKEELSDLEISVESTSNAIISLFGDMRDKSLKELTELSKRGQKALEFLKKGEWNDVTGEELGITKEQFDLWKEMPGVLKDVDESLKEVNDKTEEMAPAFDKIEEGLKDFFNSDGDSKKLKESLSKINEGVNEVMGSVQFLSGVFSNLSESFGGGVFEGIADGLNIAMDAVNSAMQGAQAGAAFGPIGAAAGAAIGVVSSLAGAIANIHDKKNEKRIQRLQDQIETLDRFYEKLGDSIEKAYSIDASDLIGQQNKLLEQQKLLIQQQIKEEEEKKKTDSERIKEWKEQIQDIDDLIADNAEKAQESITGISFESFRDNFLSTLADMNSSTEDFTDNFESYLQKSILDSLLASTYDKKIKDLYERWAKLGEDTLDQSEVEELKKEQQAIVEQMIADRDNLANIFGWDDTLKDREQNATSGAFQAMSQDSADELNGRFTALQMSGEEIRLQNESQTQILNALVMKIDSSVMLQSEQRNIADESRTIMANSYLELRQISENTGTIIKPIKEMNEKLTKIEQNTKNL